MAHIFLFWPRICSSSFLTPEVSMSRNLIKLSPIATLAITSAFAASLFAAPAHADFVDSTSSLNVTNDAALGTGSFGTLAVSLHGMTAAFTFTAAIGYGFVDSNVADVNLVTLSVPYIFQPINTPNLTQTGSGNVDGLGVMNLTTSLGDASNPLSTIAYEITS